MESVIILQLQVNCVSRIVNLMYKTISKSLETYFLPLKDNCCINGNISFRSPWIFTQRHYKLIVYLNYKGTCVSLFIWLVSPEDLIRSHLPCPASISLFNENNLKQYHLHNLQAPNNDWGGVQILVMVEEQFAADLRKGLKFRVRSINLRGYVNFKT